MTSNNAMTLIFSFLSLETKLDSSLIRGYHDNNKSKKEKTKLNYLPQQADNKNLIELDFDMNVTLPSFTTTLTNLSTIQILESQLLLSSTFRILKITLSQLLTTNDIFTSKCASLHPLDPSFVHPLL